LVEQAAAVVPEEVPELLVQFLTQAHRQGRLAVESV
jgi:hypothetical protein